MIIDGGPLPLISYMDILTQPLPPIDWLVEPFIPQGDRVVVYGEFGSLKSWLLLHLGLHIAAERTWLGEFPIPKARSVLYIDEEMNKRTLLRRIKRLGDGAKFNGSLPFQALSRWGVRFSGAGVQRLLQALKDSRFDPDVIIVEALRRVLAGNENEAADVAEFWYNVGPILRAGKTLIISHHMRKPNQLWATSDSSRNRASGSTDILAGSDTSYALQRKSHEGDQAIVEAIKLREGPEGEMFKVALVDDKTDEDSPVTLEYAGVVLRGGAAAAEPLIMPYVTQVGGEVPTAKILAMLEEKSIPKRTGEEALKKLRTKGKLNQPRRGFWTI